MNLYFLFSYEAISAYIHSKNCVRTVKESDDGEDVPVQWEAIAALCTIIPGFQIDGSIEKANVLWEHRSVVERVNFGSHNTVQSHRAIMHETGFYVFPFCFCILKRDERS